MRTRRRPAGLLLAASVLLLAPAGPALATSGASDDLHAAGVVVDPSVPAPPADLTAAGWLVADAGTGDVLAAQGAHERFAPASTIKVLTALSLLPEVPADAVLTTRRADVDVVGSKVGLLADTAYPAEELYASMLMVSGNDSANALASAVGGHQAAAERMNATARRLGARDTWAVNPHGLDAEGQASSPHDLAVFGRAALATPQIAAWVSTLRATMSGGPGQPRFEISNKNKLLYNLEGALGVKNGYTSRARASFVGAAERDGRRLVVALMRAEPRVWQEAGRLLEWGFAAAAAGAEPVGRLPELPAREPGVAPTAALDTPVQLQAAEAQEVSAARTGPPAQAPEGFPAHVVGGALLAIAALIAVRAPRRGRSSARAH